MGPSNLSLLLLLVTPQGAESFIWGSAVDAKNFLLTPCLVLPGPLWVLQDIISGVKAPARTGAGIPLFGVLALHVGRVEVNALV